MCPPDELHFLYAYGDPLLLHLAFLKYPWITQSSILSPVSHPGERLIGETRSRKGQAQGALSHGQGAAGRMQPRQQIGEGRSNALAPGKKNEHRCM